MGSTRVKVELVIPCRNLPHLSLCTQLSPSAVWNGGPRQNSSWLLSELTVLSQSLQPGSHKSRRRETWGFLLSAVKDNRDSEVSQLTPHHLRDGFPFSKETSLIRQMATQVQRGKRCSCPTMQACVRVLTSVPVEVTSFGNRMGSILDEVRLK